MPPKNNKKSEETDVNGVRTKVTSRSRKLKAKVHASYFKQVKIANRYNLPNPVRPMRYVDEEHNIEDAVVKINENESVNTHTIKMSGYKRYWYKLIGNVAHIDSVRSQLNNIFRDAGFAKDDPTVADLVNDINVRISQAAISEDSPIDGRDANMYDLAAHFFKESYNAIDKANLGPKNRIIVSQKIADVMIKNYSPAIFADGALDEYADKYVVQNKALLKDQLEKLNVKGVDLLVDNIEESLEQGFEYDETEPKIVLGTEQPVKNEPSKPQISDFYKELDKRMVNADVTDAAKSEIKDILKAAGFTDEKRIDDISEASYSFVKDKINSIYYADTTRETKMSYDAPAFFASAHESLGEYGLSPTSQIITAQKIANVMLKNYSPAAFMGKELERYTDDFVLKNKDVFKTQLDILGFRTEDIESTMNNVEAVIEGRAELEPPQTPEEIAGFTQWLNARINSITVHDRVQARLTDIIGDAGVEDPKTLGKVVDFVHHYVARTIPENPHLNGDAPDMHEIAAQFFSDSYSTLEGAGLNTRDRIIAAQMVADAMLHNYSPVASAPEKLGKYADSYVRKNATLLRERLEQLGVQDVDALINDKEIVIELPRENNQPEIIDTAKLRKDLPIFFLDRAKTEKENTNIRNILQEAGVAEDKASTVELAEIIEEAYSQQKLTDSLVPMHEVSKQVFMSTYDALTKKGLAPDNKIETVQKIADVILKNFSPVQENNELNKYARNYVTSNKELLKECLTSLKVPENEIKVVTGENEEKIVNSNEQVNNTQEPETINDVARVAVYTEKLKAYNNMYKLNIDSNKFVGSVSEAWKLMTSDNKENIPKGRKVLNDIFKDTLKTAFDVEKGVAYDEHRLPEYVEIVKSTNELMRSAMYGFTDMYHNAKRAELFDSTAFGGLNAKDMVDLTSGDSLWSKDQKSDEAWDIQAREAKSIAEKWMKEEKPHEKMIDEMKALAKANKEGIVSRKEILDKLTAAEWLLVNDEKMMIEDPEDPYNTIPNWGNRYWKTLSETREALGIDRHTSMRDMIQADYAASAKAVNNSTYNETQINNYVLDNDVRELADSRDVQKEQFAIQGAAVNLTKPQESKELEDDMTEIRKRYVVHEQDQRNIMKQEPKNDKWILETVFDKELTITGQTNAK